MGQQSWSQTNYEIDFISALAKPLRNCLRGVLHHVEGKERAAAKASRKEDKSLTRSAGTNTGARQGSGSAETLAERNEEGTGGFREAKVNSNQSHTKNKKAMKNP